MKPPWRLDRGYAEDASQTACIPFELPSCRIDGAVEGNPILPASGEKYQVERDLAGAGPDPLDFTRTYRSNAPLTDGRLGAGWMHNHRPGAIPPAETP